MEKAAPPSPAPSHHDEGLTPEFNQLVAHNTGAFVTSAAHDQVLADAIEAASQPPSRYGTPLLHGLPTYYNPQMAYAQQQYGFPPGFSPEPSAYPNPDEHAPAPLPYHITTLTPAASPPTPSGMSLRAKPRTRARPSPASKAAGPVHSGRVKKKERAKAIKKTPELEKPLSELTRDWVHTPLADIEAYVSRSTEERHREVAEGKIPGKIKRPMNAFMMYRKAYQDRAKKWCKQHNHQVVSQVCGESWGLEPEAEKKPFDDWAKKERENHHIAHPEYKFTPSKPRKKADKNDLDGDSNISDLEWTPSGRISGLRSQTPIINQNSPFQPAQPLYHHGLPSYHQPAGMPPPMGFRSGAPVGLDSRSAFHYSNPGKPLPAQYDQSDLGETYYQQTIMQSQGGQPGVQDVLVRKTPSPGAALLRGMQGGSEYDFGPTYTPPPMLGQPLPPHTASAPPSLEHRIDPSLMPQVVGLYDYAAAPIYLDNAGGLEGGQPWGAAVPTGNEGAGQPTFHESGLAEYDDDTLQGGDESWKVMPMAAVEPFDDWMGAPALTPTDDP